MVEATNTPFALSEPSTDEVDAAIARYALAYVRQGSTLQTGIGAIPNVVASELAKGPLGGFGIHSEMFTSGLMRLHQAGKVTNDAKGVFDGVSVTTFALGDGGALRLARRNADVAFIPVEVVNDPTVISRNANLVSINGALSVDLYGQVVADSIDGRQISGVGGHEDFVAGAELHLDAHSLICLRSTVRARWRGRLAYRRAPPRRFRGVHPATPHRGHHHRVRRSRADRPHRARTGAPPGGHRAPRFPRRAARKVADTIGAG